MSITAQELADMLAGESKLKMSALTVPMTFRVPVTAAAAINAVAVRAGITKTLAMAQLVHAGWEATLVAAADHVSESMTKAYNDEARDLAPQCDDTETV